MIDFETIKPWNGTTGSGRENRLLIDRNFGKVNTFAENASKGNYNVTQNTGVVYTDKTTARNAVPANLRAVGQIVTYKLTVDGIDVWVQEQFTGSTVSGWVYGYNWKSASSASDFLSKIAGYATTITSSATELAACYLDREYRLEEVGDYIELNVANLTASASNSNNISMFRGTLTNAGFFSNSFYFRSNSQNSVDYRIWTLPAGFDRTIFNKIKLQVVDGGLELFVDGVSMGVKAMSSNILISSLVNIADAIIYSYANVTIHTANADLKWNAYSVFAATLGASSVVTYSSEGVILETRLTQIEANIIANTQRIDAISNVFASDLYYSSYNRTENIESSTILSNTYRLSTVGDYFEIEARYWGNKTTYVDKLALVQGNVFTSRFGWYNDTQIWLRIEAEPYKIWTIPNTILKSDWHIYRLELVSGGWELFIDGVSMGVQVNNATANYDVKTICAKIDEVQRYDVREFKIHSSVSGDLNIRPLAFYQGSVNVELMISNDNDVDVVTINPLCFVSYDKTADKFFIYLRDREKQNTYYMFTVLHTSTRGTIDDPIFYKNFWFLQPISAVATYSNTTNSMTVTSNTLIVDGESECVYMQTNPGNIVVDFSGGVHGDESIDMTPGDFVKFYIDGVQLSDTELSASFTLKPCSEFYYLQRSSIHKTAIKLNNYESNVDVTGSGVLSIQNARFYIDGVDTGIGAFNVNTVYRTLQEAVNEGVTLSVSANNKWKFSFIRQVYEDHPIACTHIKKTVFSGQKYATENTLIYRDATPVSLWYHGICCMSKSAATKGHNEDYEQVIFDGTQPNQLTNVGHRLFEAHNPVTKLSARVTSRIVDGGGVIEDANCNMFVWDRANDSKYYRSTGAFTPILNKAMVSLMEVEYNSKL